MTETFQIDPSAVGDGNATFEIRAIEYTGQIERVRETVKLDGTPPPPVEGLKIERVLMTGTASWERPEVPAESSPIVGYEYAFVLNGQTNVTWVTTPSTSIPLPALPPGVALELYVCALEQSGSRSACRSVVDPGPSFGVKPGGKQPTKKKDKSKDKPDGDGSSKDCVVHRRDLNMLPSGRGRVSLIAECTADGATIGLAIAAQDNAASFMRHPSRGMRYIAGKTNVKQLSKAYVCPAGSVVKGWYQSGLPGFLDTKRTTRGFTCPSQPANDWSCSTVQGSSPTRRRPYIVYGGFSAGQLAYVGITQQSLAARCGQHRQARRVWAWKIQQMRFRRTFTKDEARGIEQTLINYYGRRVSTLNRNYDTKISLFPRGDGLYNIADSLPAITDAAAYCRGIGLGHTMLIRHGDIDPGGPARPLADAASSAYNKYRVPNYKRRNCG